jgi:hypothetical protein
VSSPSRNRVTPLGDIVAVPLRCAWTGNRGRLHEGREIVRTHAGNLWIICALEFKGRWHEQWRPRSFTWLFFHDEAVALAAGHRPCGECRHVAYTAYKEALGASSAQELNRRLHAERRRLHSMPWSDLPDGTFVLHEGVPAVVVTDQLSEWTTAGYGRRRGRPRRGTAEVLTPPSTVAALRAGYPVQIDHAAHGGRVG